MKAKAGKPVVKENQPVTCSYPKNCGWTDVGCGNLLCTHLTSAGFTKHTGMPADMFRSKK